MSCDAVSTGYFFCTVEVKIIRQRWSEINIYITETTYYVSTIRNKIANLARLSDVCAIFLRSQI